MTTVHSYAVGNGDMFSIRHNSDSFTIIDCSIAVDDRDRIFEDLNAQKQGKGVTRFISTHPDQDHMMGLKYLDDQMGISNFYCVENSATKDDPTEDFIRYCQLRDSDKAFYLYKDCSRQWLNEDNDVRDSAGIFIYWPITKNPYFQYALQDAAQGNSPNNISPIVVYKSGDCSFAWFGDLETDFINDMKLAITWPDIDVLFAPHHGRDSGKIPNDVLAAMNPSVIIIGEAPSEHLIYYGAYNTITQNSAGSIAFDNINSGIDIYVGSSTYSVDFLSNRYASKYKNYIGSLIL